MGDGVGRIWVRLDQAKHWWGVKSKAGFGVWACVGVQSNLVGVQSNLVGVQR